MKQRNWIDSLKTSIDRFNEKIDSLWHILIVRPILRWRRWRCDRAKLYLLQHDQDYRKKYSEDELLRKHERARHADSGLPPKPADSVLLPNGELPPLRWPQKDPF